MAKATREEKFQLFRDCVVPELHKLILSHDIVKKSTPEGTVDLDAYEEHKDLFNGFFERRKKEYEYILSRWESMTLS